MLVNIEKGGVYRLRRVGYKVPRLHSFTSSSGEVLCASTPSFYAWDEKEKSYMNQKTDIWLEKVKNVSVFRKWFRIH